MAPLHPLPLVPRANPVPASPPHASEVLWFMLPLDLFKPNARSFCEFGNSPEARCGEVTLQFLLQAFQQPLFGTANMPQQSTTYFYMRNGRKTAKYRVFVELFVRDRSRGPTRENKIAIGVSFHVLDPEFRIDALLDMCIQLSHLDNSPSALNAYMHAAATSAKRAKAEAPAPVPLAADGDAAAAAEDGEEAAQAPGHAVPARAAAPPPIESASSVLFSAATDISRKRRETMGGARRGDDESYAAFAKRLSPMQRYRHVHDLHSYALCVACPYIGAYDLLNLVDEVGDTTSISALDPRGSEHASPLHYSRVFTLERYLERARLAGACIEQTRRRGFYNGGEDDSHDGVGAGADAGAGAGASDSIEFPLPELVWMLPPAQASVSRLWSSFFPWHTNGMHPRLQALLDAAPKKSAAAAFEDSAMIIDAEAENDRMLISQRKKVAAASVESSSIAHEAEQTRNGMRIEYVVDDVKPVVDLHMRLRSLISASSASRSERFELMALLRLEAVAAMYELLDESRACPSGYKAFVRFAIRVDWYLMTDAPVLDPRLGVYGNMKIRFFLSVEYVRETALAHELHDAVHRVLLSALLARELGLCQLRLKIVSAPGMSKSYVLTGVGRSAVPGSYSNITGTSTHGIVDSGGENCVLEMWHEAPPAIANSDSDMNPSSRAVLQELKTMFSEGQVRRKRVEFDKATGEKIIVWEVRDYNNSAVYMTNDNKGSRTGETDALDDRIETRTLLQHQRPNREIIQLANAHYSEADRAIKTAAVSTDQKAHALVAFSLIYQRLGGLPPMDTSVVSAYVVVALNFLKRRCYDFYPRLREIASIREAAIVETAEYATNLIFRSPLSPFLRDDADAQSSAPPPSMPWESDQSGDDSDDDTIGLGEDDDDEVEERLRAARRHAKRMDPQRAAKRAAERAAQRVSNKLAFERFSYEQLAALLPVWYVTEDIAFKVITEKIFLMLDPVLSEMLQHISVVSANYAPWSSTQKQMCFFGVVRDDSGNIVRVDEQNDGAAAGGPVPLRRSEAGAEPAFSGARVSLGESAGTPGPPRPFSLANGRSFGATAFDGALGSFVGAAKAAAGSSGASAGGTAGAASQAPLFVYTVPNRRGAGASAGSSRGQLPSSVVHLGGSAASADGMPAGRAPPAYKIEEIDGRTYVNPNYIRLQGDIETIASRIAVTMPACKVGVESVRMKLLRLRKQYVTTPVAALIDPSLAASAQEARYRAVHEIEAPQDVDAMRSHAARARARGRAVAEPACIRTEQLPCMIESPNENCIFIAVAIVEVDPHEIIHEMMREFCYAGTRARRVMLGVPSRKPNAPPYLRDTFDMRPIEGRSLYVPHGEHVVEEAVRALSSSFTGEPTVPAAAGTSTVPVEVFTSECFEETVARRYHEAMSPEPESMSEWRPRRIQERYETRVFIDARFKPSLDGPYPDVLLEAERGRAAVFAEHSARERAQRVTRSYTALAASSSSSLNGLEQASVPARRALTAVTTTTTTTTTTATTPTAVPCSDGDDDDDDPFSTRAKRARLNNDDGFEMLA